MKLAAPPKLNRFLAVLGRRENGFHDLELVTTVLEGVTELEDILEVAPAPTLALELWGPTSMGLVGDASNLVMKAWALLEREVGRPLPAHLRLYKAIPHGAGLGGGSSDAASALKLGNAFFQLGLSTDTLLRLAAELGSDVPLFLVGGTVLGLGRGERVVPMRPIPLEPLLLVNPGLHVPTAAVYRALAQVGYPPVAPLPSLGKGEVPPWRNDLTAAAMHVCPALEAVPRALEAEGGEPLLCGSGACWVARFPSPDARNRAHTHLEAHHEGWKFHRLS